MGQKRVQEIKAEPVDTSGAKKKSKKKGKKRLQLKRARIYVKSSFNNTVITVADLNGNVVAWGSAGKTGFKGSRKSTPYAAQKTMEELMNRLRGAGIKEADVVIKGVGIGRESAVRALVSGGIEVLSIKDKTPLPHGGVRPKKARRV